MKTKTMAVTSNTLRFAAPLAAVASCFGILAPQAANAAMPHGSFLESPVNTPAQLTQTLKKNPALLKRYSAAWNLTPSQVLARVAMMHTGHVAKDGQVQVHYWRDNCDRSKMEPMRRGTPVFLDARNIPFVKHACGNPITLYRPIAPPKAAIAKATSPELPETTTGASPFDVPTSQGLLSYTAPELPALPNAVPALTGGNLLGLGAVPGIPGSLGSSLTAGLLGAGALAIPVLTHGGHTNSDQIPSPVPEPSLPVVAGSMLTLLSAGLIWGRYGRRRQNLG